MEAIPTEWVDKIFNCMAEFYGERWTRYFTKPLVEEFYKTIWRNGLQGLTYDEIKHTLKLCRRSALNPAVKPPHVIEFFRYAKKEAQPYINYHPRAEENYVKKCDPEVAERNLAEIRRKLGMTANMELYGRLVG